MTSDKAILSNSEVLNNIRREVKTDGAGVPNIAKSMPLETLISLDFSNHPIYQRKLQNFITSWSDIHSPKSIATSPASSSPDNRKSSQTPELQQPLVRKVFGDGSCLYRSVMYRLLEKIIASKHWGSYIIEKVEAARQRTIKFYDKEIIADFFDEFLAEAQTLHSDQRQIYDSNRLDGLFNNEDLLFDKNVVMLARLLTSTELRSNPERFAPFIASHFSVEEFCRDEVDPMWKEAEQTQIVALTEILGISIDVVSLDSADQTPTPSHHKFTSSDASYEKGRASWPTNKNSDTIAVMYRPGHYDILYI